MKGLAQRMAVYAAHHRHPVNRLLHAVAVPALVWSLMVALGLVDVAAVAGLEVTAAHLAAVALLAWYLALDFALGVAATAAFSVLLVSALRVADLGARPALILAGAVFVAAWAVQLVGHRVWERRRPALADDVLQVFVAPVFLAAQAAFMLGLRADLRDDVRARMQAHLPRAAPRADVDA